MNAPVSVDPRDDACSLPLDRIDVSQPRLYQDDIWYPYFERLRREDPVHWCENGMYGSYWSVTRYKDIMQVDTSQKIYSSDAMMGGIVLRDTPMDYPPAELHLDGPAEARRAAQGGVAGRRTDEPAASLRHDPRAHAARAGRTAARRGVRLGRSRVDRTDHADARHAVRLPVRGAAEAHLLVERRDGEHARRHRDRLRREARRGAAAGDGVFRRSSGANARSRSRGPT